MIQSILKMTDSNKKEVGQLFAEACKDLQEAQVELTAEFGNEIVQDINSNQMTVGRFNNMNNSEDFPYNQQEDLRDESDGIISVNKRLQQ